MQQRYGWFKCWFYFLNAFNGEYNLEDNIEELQRDFNQVYHVEYQAASEIGSMVWRPGSMKLIIWILGVNIALWG